MKKIISKTLALVVFLAISFSFTSNFGGEGFEISLNGKVVLQQFGKEMEVLKTIQLNSASPDDKLTIKYHHCGKVAKNRIVTIKDGQDKLVKEWRFKDDNKPYSEMSCSAQEILNLKKGSTQVLKLFYSSSELPAGRQLAVVSLEKSNTVATVK